MMTSGVYYNKATGEAAGLTKDGEVPPAYDRVNHELSLCINDGVTDAEYAACNDFLLYLFASNRMNRMQKDLRKHAGIGHSKSQSVMIAMTFVILIALYGIFMVFPIGYAAVGSFFDWRPSRGQYDFIGFKNYIWLFTNKTTLSSLGNTLYFTVVAVIFRTLTGLIFAALINEISHGKALYRTLFFLRSSPPPSTWRWCGTSCMSPPPAL